MKAEACGDMRLLMQADLDGEASFSAAAQSPPARPAAAAAAPG
jgi:hypothetical protein